MDSRTVITELAAIYDAAVERLRSDIAAYVRDGTAPPESRRSDGSYCYPELRLRYFGGSPVGERTRSFGRLHEPGTYVTTITRPDQFEGYLTEQLDLLIEDFDVEIEIGRSGQEIPFPYVLDGQHGAEMVGISPNELARHFPTTELALIGDELADSILERRPGEPLPLSLFDALRTDFSLARLAHYTGSAPRDFQRFVLLTNYHRYIDEFVDWAGEQIGDGTYTALTGAGGLSLTGKTANARAQLNETTWRSHQMPAYHLKAADGLGITLVNIGVGPSNAKTITDHLAVLRPEAWLMIGHCGGLRPSQKIGDFVLAHAYLRDDHVLDDMLPPEIPLPAIAEVQQALYGAAEEVSGTHGADIKQRVRTGTVVTTDDRNWELRYTLTARRLSQSRAVAIEMESATVAAQGFRFRVPYGTLLCVSDKPLHGEIKLPGQANKFYEEAIAAHLQIGIRACERLRAEGPRLHSRKLRAFNEPPFR
ncbi:AMP nucleosidase [Croceibacterium aestuarii]|uniref:AMP nucleosidase n=1 Tax=Croceibacterium aestuarii TaxID=3064139 RepID=UPI00272E9F05|nr:AMP nucleosidase [Croceibacterium sp. D39]